MDLVSVQQFLMMKVQVLKFRYAHLNVCQGAENYKIFLFSISVQCSTALGKQNPQEIK